MVSTKTEQAKCKSLEQKYPEFNNPENWITQRQFISEFANMLGDPGTDEGKLLGRLRYYRVERERLQLGAFFSIVGKRCLVSRFLAHELLARGQQ